MKIERKYCDILDKLGWGVVISSDHARLYHSTSILGSFDFRVGNGDFADLVADYAIEFNAGTWMQSVLELLPKEYVAGHIIALSKEAEEIQKLLLQLGIELLKASKTL